MEIGPTTETFATERVRAHAKQLSLDYEPRVVFTLHELQELRGALPAFLQKPIEQLHIEGWADVHNGIILVLAHNHCCLTALSDTCAHETTHLRWPSLDHSHLFDRRVRATLRGTRCSPRGKRLPKEFL